MIGVGIAVHPSSSRRRERTARRSQRCCPDALTIDLLRAEFKQPRAVGSWVRIERRSPLDSRWGRLMAPRRMPSVELRGEPSRFVPIMQ